MSTELGTSFIERIFQAQERLKGVVLKTPLKRDHFLSRKFNCDIFLKQENLQETRSYKIRGAYNKMVQLRSVQGVKRVVCASAGNHAQGVAHASCLLQMKADIFMPTTTPAQKIGQVKMFGGESIKLHLVGDTFEEALAEALKYVDLNGIPFIPPFDDPEIIAGQGTIALELLQQSTSVPDYVIVPVGGGGLAAGIAQVLSKLSPETKLITVEPEGAPSLKAALKVGRPICLDKVDPFVDGAAVKCIGSTTFGILKDKIALHITIPEGKVCTTILETYNKAGLVLEPAGALSIAALSQLKKIIRDKTIVCVISGGNNDITRMEEIKERSLLYEDLKHYFLVRFPQRAGALKEFVSNVLEPHQDISHFEYIKRTGKEKGSVLVGIELPEPKGHLQLQRRMEDHNFSNMYLNDKPEIFDLLV